MSLSESFRTGDLGRLVDPASSSPGSEGARFIEFVSREASSHVKVRGFKVFPELLEAELRKHPDVETAYCAAVGEEGDDTTSRLEAAVALKVGSSASSATLRAFMAERVPPYMVPVAFRKLSKPQPVSDAQSQAGKGSEDGLAVPALLQQSGKTASFTDVKDAPGAGTERRDPKEVAALLASLPSLDAAGPESRLYRLSFLSRTSLIETGGPIF